MIEKYLDWAEQSGYPFDPETDQLDTLIQAYNDAQPFWNLFQSKLLSDSSIRDLFFQSVDPSIQNKFLLSIRVQSIPLMIDAFNQFKDIFSTQQLEVVRYALIDCNFNPNLFFPAEETQP